MWVIYALLSGFSSAVLALVVKIYLGKLNPFFVTLIFSLVGAFLIFMIDLFTKRIHISSITTLVPSEWTALIVGGCLNCLAFACYVTAIKNGKVSSAVALDRAGILFLSLLSVLILQEPFNVKNMIGAVLLIAGTSLLMLK